MAKLRVEPFEDMGDPAILLNTDQDGITIFDAAVRQAHETGHAVFEHDGIKHEVVQEDGAADIELGSSTPGHQHFDELRSPVDLLVLSQDEYKRPLNYGEFSELYPVRPTPEAGKFLARRPPPAY